MIAHKKNFIPLLGIVFLDLTAITLTYPLITLIFFDNHSRLFSPSLSAAERSVWYGLCLSLPNIINIIVAPFLSALSDHIGRKKILLLEIFRGLLFTLIVGLGIYSGTLALVLLGFAIKGAFARPSPTPLAIIGDIATPAKKIICMGYLQFATSIGATLGPILGGYFAMRFFFPELNFSLPFFIGSLFAAINLGCAATFIGETLQPTTTQTLKRVNLKNLITQPTVWRLLLLLFVIQLSWSTYYQFMPPLLKIRYHFDANQLGWFIGMIAFWLALATGLLIKLLHGFLHVHQLLLLSLYLLLLGLIITIVANTAHPLWLWLGAMPTAIGDVIAYSCLVAALSNAVTMENQGKIMGFSFLVAASAWTLTGFFGGLLLSIAPELPLLLAPIGVLVALGILHARCIRQLC